MAEYVEREPLLKFLKHRTETVDDGKLAHGVNIALEIIEEYVANIPADDVRPEKHGEWVFGEFNGIGYPVWCSECEVGFVGNNNPAEWLKCPEHQYCGNCGAKMGGKDGTDNE